MRGRLCEEDRGFKREASAVADGGGGHGDKVSSGKREPSDKQGMCSCQKDCQRRYFAEHTICVTVHPNRVIMVMTQFHISAPGNVQA